MKIISFVFSENSNIFLNFNLSSSFLNLLSLCGIVDVLTLLSYSRVSKFRNRFFLSCIVQIPFSRVSNIVAISF